MARVVGWAALVFLVVGPAGGARADTVRWINPAGGNFGDGANWDRGTPPGPNDMAVFNIAATYTVTVSQDVQLQGLSVSGDTPTLVMTDRLVQVGVPGGGGSGLSISGRVNLIGGRILIGSGDVDVMGGPVIAQGTVISDKGAGGSHVARSSISGTVQGLSVITESVHAEGQFTMCGFGGDTAGLGPGMLNGGGIGSSDATGLQGPLTVRGGAHVNCDRWPIRFIGPIAFEGDGTLIETLGTVESGEVSFGAGVTATGPSLSIYSRAILKDDCRLDANITCWQGGTLRLEPASVGPRGLYYQNGLNVRTEVVVDGASEPAFHARAFNAPFEPQGTFAVSVRNPNGLRIGDEVLLITSTIQGSFAVVQVPTLGGGRVLEVITEPTRILARVVPGGNPCWSADFNGDGDSGTDQDIAAFFACLAGDCCPLCAPADFNSDGDTGTDQDIEAFFRVLAGGSC
jgi:hypothetical protein